MILPSEVYKGKEFFSGCTVNLNKPYLVRKAVLAKAMANWK